MKVKKLLLTTFIIAISIMMFSTIKSFAEREIVEFYRHALYDGVRTNRTKFARKDVTNRSYAVRLNWHNGFRIVAKHVMVDGNGHWAEDTWSETYEGTRSINPNRGQEGIYYALDMKRQFEWDGYDYITGSWSPDEF